MTVIINQAMRLKCIREQRPYVPPPSRSWASDHMHQLKNLKILVSSPLEADRVEACSKGRIGDWFDRIESQVNPRQ